MLHPPDAEQAFLALIIALVVLVAYKWWKDRRAYKPYKEHGGDRLNQKVKEQLIASKDSRGNAFLYGGVAIVVLGIAAFNSGQGSLFGIWFVGSCLAIVAGISYYNNNIREPSQKREQEAIARKQWEKAREPATIEQTQQAVLQLRLAEASLDGVGSAKTRDKQYELLSVAERALEQAAKIDPHATFREQVMDNVYFTYTFDYLAADLYLCHAGMVLTQAEHEWKQWVDVDQDFSTRQKEREFRKDQKKLHDEAEDFAKRALEFQPTSGKHLRMLAKVYLAARKHQEARETLKKAQEHEPDNLETVRLMNEIPS